MLASALLLGVIAAAAGERACAPVPVPDWTASVTTAEAAFADRDEPAFDAAMTRLGDVLPCLDAVVSSPLAGRYHRLVALRLYARGDQEGARLAFAAARAVDPFGAIPSALLPAGHAARALAAEASTPGATALVRTQRASWHFDGVATDDRPLDRPTVAQLERAGGIATSRYLAPGDPLPAAGPRHPVAHRVASGVGAGLLVGALGFYGAGLRTAAVFEGPQPAGATRDDLVGLQRRANRFVAVSAGLGAAGIGVCAVAAVPW